MRAEEMRKKASMDPLTGLKNRRAMLNDIQEMLETLSDPLWLVCLDLDNFKSINDQYGHDIGDQYLRRFGTMLEEMTEQNGQAYRTCCTAEARQRKSKLFGNAICRASGMEKSRSFWVLALAMSRYRISSPWQKL